MHCRRCIVTVEYKYAVYDDQGRVAAAWKPGGNFMLSMPTAGDSSVKIKDAWDEGYREVQVRTCKEIYAVIMK